jgi:hypothetical protein
MGSAADTEGTGLEREPLLRGHSPLLRAYLPDAILPRAGSLSCQRAEIEARDDGCDRLAHFGVIR